VRLPGIVPAGAQVRAHVANADIAPTVLELAGIPKPKDMQGRSFLKTLKNPEKQHRKAVYYHYYENGEHAVSPHFGVRDDRYKLIRFYKRVDAWELYDLLNDPGELNNLYDDPGYRAVLRKMKRKLRKEIRDFDDQEAGVLMKGEPGEGN